MIYAKPISHTHLSVIPETIVHITVKMILSQNCTQPCLMQLLDCYWYPNLNQLYVITYVCTYSKSLCVFSTPMTFFNPIAMTV